MWSTLYRETTWRRKRVASMCVIKRPKRAIRPKVTGRVVRPIGQNGRKRHKGQLGLKGSKGCQGL